ncbi:CehA/McbA family metallohydrolase, partial [Candidatus Acetothermia bacterium]|nr:CehA/McbA family metallohydrolase [Candidatus Acetothermia bacterium]
KGDVVHAPSVIVMKNDKPYIKVTGDQQSAFSQKLALGDYKVVVKTEGYTDSETKTVTITEGKTAKLDFVDILGPAPVTFKVSYKGQGADAQIRAYLNDNLLDVLFTDSASDKVGQVTRDLPAGHYKFVINAGAGFTRDWMTKEIDLEPGKPATVEVQLPDKKYDPEAKGWYAADTHLHTQFSFDGTTKIDDFFVSQLAAGLDLMFISDHNTISGHDPLSKLSQARKVPYVLSEEITTQTWGHFNPYPLNKGQLISWSGKPAEFFTESKQKGNAQLIQVNHPLVSSRDYFRHLKDSDYVPDFNAAEVYNASFGPDDEETVQLMFKFWNEGKKYTAVAVTDDHNAYAIELDTGTPRSYAYVTGDLTVEKWIDAIKNQHVFVSYGPLVYASIGTAIPGDTAGIAAGGKAELKAELNSIAPLKKAAIVKNGQVVKEFDLSKNEETISFEVPAEDAWYVVRVYTATEGIQAMTNPIWVKVGANTMTSSSNSTQTTPPASTNPTTSTSNGTTPLPATFNAMLRNKLQKVGLSDAFLFLINGDKITDQTLARATELWAIQQSIPNTDHIITNQELMRFTLLKLVLEEK